MSSREDQDKLYNEIKKFNLNRLSECIQNDFDTLRNEGRLDFRGVRDRQMRVRALKEDMVQEVSWFCDRVDKFMEDWLNDKQ